MPKVDVICGGQFGSEGKGQLAGFIIEKLNRNYNIVISNSGSQAGHTYVRDNNYKIVTRHVPIAGILDSNATIIIGPAATIDLAVLEEEINRFNLEGRIFIHANAAIIDEQNKKVDRELISPIGSTGKGNGATLARKIMRRNDIMKRYSVGWPKRIINHDTYQNEIRKVHSILIEGSQGFSLSLDGLFYPYCTARNCWVGQYLADAWIHPYWLWDVYMAIRTYPIRVGGNSGPGYPDQEEITWETLGVPPEITTVTGRVRRVFTFSQQQLRDAVYHNRPNYLAISHMDYALQDAQNQFINMVLRQAHSMSNWKYTPQLILGYGPTLDDWNLYQ